MARSSTVLYIRIPTGTDKNAPFYVAQRDNLKTAIDEDIRKTVGAALGTGDSKGTPVEGTPVQCNRLLRARLLSLRPLPINLQGQTRRDLREVTQPSAFRSAATSVLRNCMMSCNQRANLGPLQWTRHDHGEIHGGAMARPQRIAPAYTGTGQSYERERNSKSIGIQKVDKNSTRQLTALSIGSTRRPCLRCS